MDWGHCPLSCFGKESYVLTGGSGLTVFELFLSLLFFSVVSTLSIGGKSLNLNSVLNGVIVLC